MKHFTPVTVFKLLLQFLTFCSLEIVPVSASLISNPLPTCVANDSRDCKIPIALFACSSESEEYSTTVKVKYDFKHHIIRTVGFLRILVLSTIHFPPWSKNKTHPQKPITFLEIHLFSNQGEDEFGSIQDEIQTWDPVYQNAFSLTHHKVNWPSEFQWMKDIYAPCVTFKFLLPDVLPQLDSIIYLDTDILFASSPRDLWNLFRNFSAENELALDQRYLDEDKVNPFNTEKVRALDKVLGLHSELNFNSGVSLFNLTRMRNNGKFKPWIQSLQVYREHLFSDDVSTS